MAAVHFFMDLGVYKTSAREKFAKILSKILAEILAKNDDRHLRTAKPTPGGAAAPPRTPALRLQHG